MKFEKISKYANDEGVKLPIRKTESSAGYDFFVAEDTVIPSYFDLAQMIQVKFWEEHEQSGPLEPLTLDEIANLTKAAKAKPTLVPTGIKADIDSDHFLQLSVRSSCPLKYWLVLINSVGIIDADYYNNPDNEGHIYFQIVNLSPYPIKLKRGDCIGQGIILPYATTEDDNASGVRAGGFGSTGA